MRKRFWRWVHVWIASALVDLADRFYEWTGETSPQRPIVGFVEDDDVDPDAPTVLQFRPDQLPGPAGPA